MKNAKRVSHTGTVRGQFHADELAVMYLTGLTLNELTDLKTDMGKEWLVKYCTKNVGFSEQTASELWVDEQLLQWWNLEWKKQDHYVILPVLYSVIPEKRREVYEQMHGDVFLSSHPQHEMMELSLMRLAAKRLNQKLDV